MLRRLFLYVVSVTRVVYFHVNVTCFAAIAPQGALGIKCVYYLFLFDLYGEFFRYSICTESMCLAELPETDRKGSAV